MKVCINCNMHAKEIWFLFAMWFDHLLMNLTPLVVSEFRFCWICTQLCTKFIFIALSLFSSVFYVCSFVVVFVKNSTWYDIGYSHFTIILQALDVISFILLVELIFIPSLVYCLAEVHQAAQVCWALCLRHGYAHLPLHLLSKLFLEKPISCGSNVLLLVQTRIIPYFCAIKKGNLETVKR